MKFNKIESYEKLLDYINRTGIIAIDRNSPGWIPYWQSQASDIINTIEAQYGIKYPLKNYPYYENPVYVRYTRPTEIDYHGYITVKLPDNNTYTFQVD